MIDRNGRFSFPLGLLVLPAALLFTAPGAVGSPIALTWVHATVRVENEWRMAGTGFLVIRKIDNKLGKVFLVTNKHVIHLDPEIREKAEFLTLFLNVREKDGTVVGKSFQVPLKEDDQKLWRGHPTPPVDVVAVDITSLINSQPNIENQGADYSLFATPQILKKEDITEGEEVLILGYPLGLVHSRLNSPIVRQGIVATKIGHRIRVLLPSSSGEPARVEIPGFLIDAQIIPGSSGSPVVLKPVIGRKVRDKIEMVTATPYLLGIVSATETTAIRMEGYAFPTLAGLGIAYDASTIKETIELFFPPERRP
ncbi:MAG: S1 family peptidase [Planctomycetaceae bacterium]